MKKILKVGLVGASAKGGWSPIAHIPALKALNNIELAAVCTSRPESANAASEAFNVDRAFYDIHELVSQTDLDIISCVVKIPNHYDIVKAALKAGKHVYCEWPLGASLRETRELAALAKEKKLTTAIGLQGHRAPGIIYLKQLVDEGWFGQIVNVRMTLQSKASFVKANRKAWQDEIDRQATLFSIVGGHTFYYLSHVLGEITDLSADLSVQIKEITLQDTGEKVSNTIPDQILVNGKIENEIPFLSQLSAVPYHNQGWQMEIYGTEAMIIATSPVMPQITPIQLRGARGDEDIKEIPIPESSTLIKGLPNGPALNVGINYGSMATAISNSEEFHPNFEDALMIHRLLDTIQESNKEKRTIKLS